MARSPSNRPEPGTSSRLWRLVGPFLVVAPVILVLLACRQGIGLDWDAVVYLSAADSFANTGRLIDFRGNPLTTFAPGLPTLVGILLKTGATFNAIGIGIGVVTVATTLVTTWIVAKQVLGSAPASWIAAALVGFSVNTVRVFSMLKTEAIFVPLVMLTLALCLGAISAHRTPLWWVLAVAGTASSATTVRYIGFTLILMGALAAFLAKKECGIWRAVLSATTTGVAASAGLAIVLARNLQLGSAAFGDRSPSGLTARDVGTDTLQVLGAYILPAESASAAQTSLGLFVIGLIVLGAATAISRRSVPAIYLCLFVCGYLVTLMYSEFATVISPVNERLLAPILPPIVILGLMGLHRLGWSPANPEGRPSCFRRFAKLFALGLLTVTLITSVASSAALRITVARRVSVTTASPRGDPRQPKRLRRFPPLSVSLP